MAKLEDLVFSNYVGRNGSDPPFKIIDGQCREALNIDFYKSSLGRKRSGSAAVSQTGGTAFTGPINALAVFEVDEDKGNDELFAVDSAATEVVKRLAGGTTWANVTLLDAFTDNASARGFIGTSFNGKLFCAYNTSVNRLHVYDPADASIRRVGLEKPTNSGTTPSNTGSGSLSATIRYYKQAWLVKSGSDKLRRSELTSAVGFTPSGSGTGVVVTMSTASSPAEGETHWELYASADDNTYFLHSTTAVATTTVTDTTEPSAYSGDAPPLVGTNVPPPSAKYIIADDARIIMAGAYETSAGYASAPLNNRVWWTSLLNTNNVGDDERVADISGVVSNYIDVEAPITGLGGPMLGSFYAFSYRNMWKFVSTGNSVAPYLRINLGDQGCIDHRTIVLAEDEAGNPALYWLSPGGPRYLGIKGSATLVDDILDHWETINLEATSRVAHGEYYSDKHQIWWWIATGDSNTPNVKLVYDTRLGKMVKNGVIRGGWSVHDGVSAAAMSSVSFSSTLGSSMSGLQKPYVSTSTGAVILKCDTGTNDNSTNFQAYVNTHEVNPAGLGRTTQITEDPYIYAESSAGVTLQLTVDRDFGVETFTSTASIAAGASETRVRVKLEGTHGADAETMSFRVGDAAAASNGWNLDALVVPVSTGSRDGAGD